MTPERFHRLKSVLDRRQPDLTVVLDNVHKSHNFSAILRSCDAVGVLDAHAVWPARKLALHHMTSAGTAQWMRVRTHAAVGDACAALAGRGFTLVAANPGEGARDFREHDYTVPTAVILGAELEGVSDAGLAAADARIDIPMTGMAHSLNVSVAAALILFEAQRQRAAAGLYDRSRLDPALHAALLFEWAHPRIAAYCRRNGVAYPPLDDDGAIRGEFRLGAAGTAPR